MKTNLLKTIGTVGILFSFQTAIAASTDAKCQVQYVATSPAVNFLNQISSIEDYQTLTFRNSNSNYVKFLIELKNNNKIYFQNTTTYDYHFPFMKSVLSDYAGMTDQQYDDFLFSKTKKKLSAGAIYWSACLKLTNFSKAGAMGFGLYFKNEANLEEIKQAYTTLKKSVKFANDQLIFVFENDADLKKHQDPLKKSGVPSTSLSQFIQDSGQPIAYNKAVSYGYLKSVSLEQILNNDYTAKDILVLNDIPLDIGPVAGIISSAPQMPHSHIILRTMNQNVPNAYIPDAKNLSVIIKNFNKLVKLTVNEDGSYEILSDTDINADDLNQQAEDYYQNRIPQLPSPQKNLTIKNLKAFTGAKASKVTVKDIEAYGAKGVNFALLHQALINAKQDRSYFLGSFLIPFSVYNAHISQPLTDEVCTKAAKSCQNDHFTMCASAEKICRQASNQNASIKSFLNHMSSKTVVPYLLQDSQLRKSSLAFMREVIKKSDLPEAEEKTIMTSLKANFKPNQRIRFRSSTNAEDLPGLNGAGLYESKAGCLGDTTDTAKDGKPSVCTTEIEIQRTQKLIQKLKTMDEKKYEILIQDLQENISDKRPVSKALKGVFASLWTEKAFLNRDYYRIPHSEIFMGVLVHPSFVNEAANGVALIKINADNPKDPQNEKFNILEANVVVQKDDISITNPEIPSATPEQFIAKFKDNKITDIKYISKSNLVSVNSKVLNSKSVTSLMNQLSVVYQAMSKAHKTKVSTLFDVEFILLENGLVQIKQARPLIQQELNPQPNPNPNPNPEPIPDPAPPTPTPSPVPTPGPRPGPVPTPTPSPTPSPTPKPSSQGIFSHKRHNHGWNSFKMNFDGNEIVFDTPEGQNGDKDNLTFGFRPKIRFNHASWAGANNTNSEIYKSKSKIPANIEVTYYCQDINSLTANISAQYPMSANEILKLENTPLAAVQDTCNIQIKKPVTDFTEDKICAVSFTNEKLNGPANVVLYVPYENNGPSPAPFVTSWPSKNAIMCVDGKLIQLSKQ